MNIEPDKLYLVAEVADILRCGPSTVYALLAGGQMARTAIGAGSKGLRVRGADIVDFLDSRRQGGPQPRGSFKYLRPRSPDGRPHSA